MIYPILLNPHAMDAPSTAWSLINKLRRVPAWLLILGAASPVIVWFVKRLDDGSDEPLGLLVLILALALTWRDRKSFRANNTSRIWATLILAASVLTIYQLPPMIRGAMVVAGTATWFGIHRKPGLLGLLILSLPVVASLQFYAGFPLRLASAEGAVRVLELGGIVVARNGVNISIGGVSVAVDPACGGIRMLWHAMVAGMALATIHRTSWRATFSAGLLAILLVIPANTLRAAWLALEESGRMQSAGLGHGNVGLVCFLIVLIPLWIVISKFAQPAQVAAASSTAGALPMALLFVSAIMAPVMMMRNPQPLGTIPALEPPENFTFNGLTLPLHPQAPSAEETAFAASFPGSLSSYQWGGSQVILRRVTQATRKLHPSADCLRAAGFSTGNSVTVIASDGSQWSKFHADRDGERFTVHERVVSEQDGSTWTDVPAWFWSALRRPLNGPWRAETLISR